MEVITGKVEAPVPWCNRHKVEHERIKLNPTSYQPHEVYRCPVCFTYGGPVLVEVEEEANE